MRGERRDPTRTQMYLHEETAEKKGDLVWGVGEEKWRGEKNDKPTHPEMSASRE